MFATNFLSLQKRFYTNLTVMKKLSLPLNDFANVIEGNRIYVDKTKHLLPLVQEQGFYFLSRPRRFGKSLL